MGQFLPFIYVVFLTTEAHINGFCENSSLSNIGAYNWILLYAKGATITISNSIQENERRLLLKNEFSQMSYHKIS